MGPEPQQDLCLQPLLGEGVSSETFTAQRPREDGALARVTQQIWHSIFAPVFLPNLGL